MAAFCERLDHGFADPDLLGRQRLNVFPDGRGLPPGRGTVADGARLFAQHCAGCHGRDGRGGSADELTGATRPLTSVDADKTIGSYWPYATTLFDFIRRAKPMNAPGTLEADEVAQGFVLSCQARPTTERLVVTYDER